VLCGLARTYEAELEDEEVCDEAEDGERAFGGANAKNTSFCAMGMHNRGGRAINLWTGPVNKFFCKRNLWDHI
jgi:hypothetical protein